MGTTLFKATIAGLVGVTILSWSASLSAAATPAQKKTPEKSKVAVSVELEALERKLKKGQISRKDYWRELAELDEKAGSFSKSEKAVLLSAQSETLLDAGLPIVAAIYAAQSVRLASTPHSKDVREAWFTLATVAKSHAIQNLLEEVADDIKIADREPPAFGSNWNYIVGNAARRSGDVAKALSAYRRVRVSDRYFFPAKYQEAMIHVDAGRLKDAEVVLKAILYPATQELTSLPVEQRNEMVNHARMALARINYEQKDFQTALRLYRNVERTSSEFYDALFEQSWSLFMAGYPNHALGAIHSVESPFFSNAYNPEAKMLRALIYYWMCRYADSREALAEFMSQGADAVESLGRFLDRKQLREETAYQLFEDLVSGVSGSSLGISRNVLLTAAQKDSMLHARDQYASIVEETRRLDSRGVFGLRAGTKRPAEYLDKWAGTLRREIGRRFLGELRALKQDYDRLHSQAEFLYVELLMSEKDQLLGKELHASTKISNVSMKQDIAGWGKKTQAWDPQSEKNEFWWDEVGFYIYRVQPQCTAP